VFCDPDWIRTNDPQLRRLMLYPAELPDQLFNICSSVLEPMTFPIKKSGCSIQLSYRTMLDVTLFARAAAKVIFCTIASKRIVHGCSDRR
jgi:hypothetical protein